MSGLFGLPTPVGNVEYSSGFWFYLLSDLILGILFLMISGASIYLVSSKRAPKSRRARFLFIALMFLLGMIYLASALTAGTPLHQPFSILKTISTAILLGLAVFVWLFRSQMPILLDHQQALADDKSLRDEIERRKASEHVLGLRNRDLERLNASLDMLTQDLRKADERLKLAVEGGELGLWDWNIETNEDWFSEKWLEHLGYRPGEIDYHFDTFEQHIHPDDHAHVMTMLDAHLKNNSRYHPEFRMRTKTGDYIWVEAYGTSQRNKAGEPTRMSGTLLNVTGWKKAQGLLAQRTRELERSNQDLASFAYVASHDLQEPVRKIAGFAQLIERQLADNADDTTKQYLAFLVDGAMRMQQLIRDLLAYSRVGNKPVTITDVNLSDVISSVESNLSQEILDAGATVMTGVLPTLRADLTQMEGLLQNLIGNAIKYRGEHPPIVEIDAERSGDGYLISVKDNGIGIDPKDKDKVFDLFKRLHATSDFPGTGIGLAICKQVVDRHGGHIWVEPSPGEGSIFKFVIPDPGQDQENPVRPSERGVA